MCVTVAPLECVAAEVPSSPRVIVHVVPDTFVTVMISESTRMRNREPSAVTGAGKPVLDVTVQDVAPVVLIAADRVVAALLLKSSPGKRLATLVEVLEDAEVGWGHVDQVELA